MTPMQRKADIRGIPKHVEMLFGKTCLCLFVCGDVTSPPCVFEFTFISAHFTSVTLRLGSRAGRVSWLPSALYQLPCIQIRSPSYLFLQLTHLSEAKCGVQTGTKQFLPDVASHFCATQEPLLISPCRLLAIMTFPPGGNMPGLARIIGAC